MKVKVQGNTTEQIKRGIEPQAEMIIEVNLANLTPEQREVLASGKVLTAVESTEADVAAALQAMIDERAAEVEKQRKEQEQRDNDARQACADAQLSVGEHSAYGVLYQAYSIPYISSYGVSPDVQLLVKSTLARLQSEAERLNAETKAAAQPQIDAAIAAQLAKEKLAKEKENAEKQATFAKRLETGIVEIPLSRGSRSEWGEPWIAKVTSGNGRRPNYAFSEGSYDVATEKLSIPCKPGEVIAYGQKNYKKERRTIHNVLKMNPDGGLV